MLKKELVKGNRKFTEGNVDSYLNTGKVRQKQVA